MVRVSFTSAVSFAPAFALAFTLAVCSCAEAYHERYPNECRRAKSFFEEYGNGFEQAGRDAGLSAAFLFAIVAPELSQVAYVSNKMETLALKMLYVHGGAQADFSIGPFQMKPSFIERMETRAAAESDLKERFADCLFVDLDSPASRAERIDRINTVEWSLRYLTLFCALTDRSFGALSFASEEEKLCFYATAYNCGFHKSEQQIRATASQALYPHFAQKKFKYRDVARWFYCNFSII